MANVTQRPESAARTIPEIPQPTKGHVFLSLVAQAGCLCGFPVVSILFLYLDHNLHWLLRIVYLTLPFILFIANRWFLNWCISAGRHSSQGASVCAFLFSLVAFILAISLHNRYIVPRANMTDASKVLSTGNLDYMEVPN